MDSCFLRLLGRSGILTYSALHREITPMEHGDQSVEQYIGLKLLTKTIDCNLPLVATK